MYTVGQQMPLMEVPAPNSRAANQFVKLRMQAFVYRSFLKKSNHQRRLRISDVYAAFPQQTDTAIRKRFKDCADFQRGGDDSGWWTLKESFSLPNEEELQKMVSPESVCCFESMLAGQQHLVDKGISTFTNVGTIPQAITGLPEGDPLKQRAMLVENELLLTPWNLTYNFISSMQGKGRLQLTGLGDPTGRGEMISYLRMPQKVIQQKQKQLKENIPKYQVFLPPHSPKRIPPKKNQKQKQKHIGEVICVANMFAHYFSGDWHRRRLAKAITRQRSPRLA
jgi:transcription initiation factor TFIID subunit 1